MILTRGPRHSRSRILDCLFMTCLSVAESHSLLNLPRLHTATYHKKRAENYAKEIQIMLFWMEHSTEILFKLEFILWVPIILSTKYLILGTLKDMGAKSCANIWENFKKLYFQIVLTIILAIRLLDLAHHKLLLFQTRVPSS